MLKVWTSVGLALAAVGCGQSTRDPAEPVVPLAPGTCVNTDCTLPAVEPFQSAPNMSCVPMEGAPIAVEWSQPAGEVDCASGKCVAFPVDVAVGPGEETWTATALAPSVDVQSPLVGLELLRNDPVGALELAQQTHVLQPLTEQTESALGMNVDAQGELDWVGPSPSSSGVSLMHFDRDGERVATRWLIQHAEQSLAHFGPHGITVKYGYVGGVDTSVDPPIVKRGGGTARFDAEGRLVWNQTALAGWTGVASDGSVFVLGGKGEPVGDGYPAPEPGPVLLARLAPDGHVVWVHSMPASWMLAAMNVANDTFVFSTMVDDVTIVHAVDLDGHIVWTTSISVHPYGPYDMMTSDGGRALLFGAPLIDTSSENGMVILSADGASCAFHAFSEQSDMGGGVHARLPGERLAFASSNLRGVLKVP